LGRKLDNPGVTTPVSDTAPDWLAITLLGCQAESSCVSALGEFLVFEISNLPFTRQLRVAEQGV